MPKPISIGFMGIDFNSKLNLTRALGRYLYASHHFVQIGYANNENEQKISNSVHRLQFNQSEEPQFEGQYYMISRNIVSDVETRRIAMNDGCRFVLFENILLDIIPYTESSLKINIENKNHLKGLIFEHFKRFPINHIFHVECGRDFSVNKKDAKFHASVLEEYSNLLEYLMNKFNTRFIPIREDSFENQLKTVIDEILH